MAKSQISHTPPQRGSKENGIHQQGIPEQRSPESRSPEPPSAAQRSPGKTVSELATAAQPSAVQPSAVQPSAVQPSAVQPGAVQPSEPPAPENGVAKPNGEPKSAEASKVEPLRNDDVFFRLKGIIEEAVETHPRSRRFHERDEDPLDRLRFELLQKQIEARTAEALPKARTGESLVIVAAAVAMIATSLTIFFSLSSTLSEVQATERDLTGKVAAIATAIEGLEDRFDRREAADDKRDERLQKLEAALNRLEAQLERTPARR